MHAPGQRTFPARSLILATKSFGSHKPPTFNKRKSIMAKKNNVKPTTITITFTRAEFLLFESLLDTEAQSPLAQMNDRYGRMLEELSTRVRSVGTGGNAFATDSLTVTG